MKRTFLLLLSGLLWVSCERKTAADVYDKDPYVDVYREDPAENDSILKANNAELTLRPLRVIFTGYPQYALLPMLKVRYDDDGSPYTNDIEYNELSYRNENDYEELRNKADYYNMHNNIVAGFGAIYGDDLMNILITNNTTGERKMLFEQPVRIKNFYYPSPLTDVLANKPVKRQYYMVSCYDEDTNKDGYINRDDLRRFYLFSLDGKPVRALIEKNYGVVGSDYDYVNDLLFVYAYLDSNNNGKIDAKDPKHIFRIDLKKPETTSVVYN